MQPGLSDFCPSGVLHAKISDCLSSMTDGLEEYCCSHCGFKARTSARLNSHISQSSGCLEKAISANQPSMSTSKRHRSLTPPAVACDNLTSQPDDMGGPIYSSLLDDSQPSKKRMRTKAKDDIPFNTETTFDEFNPPAGEPQPKPPNMSNTFEHLQETQRASGSKPWAPFSSVEDWDYARWTMSSDLSQRQIDSMLALDLVSKGHIAMSGAIITHIPSLGQVRLSVLLQ